MPPTHQGSGRSQPVGHWPALSDRFAWGHLLGKGGMGSVISASDARLRREVALKILNPTLRPDAPIRFLDEAQITAQLQHPNIIPIYDIIDSADGQPIIAMKPIDGQTFATVIRQAHQRGGAAGIGAELRRLLEIFSKVCDAVAFAHSRGIIHRDLKPSNIMVGEFGDVVLMDWGLAKPIGFTPPENSAGRSASDAGPKITSDRREMGLALTASGTVQGTPAYMAPEQALGGRALDEGADVFALGGILYTLLTNHLPVDGDTVGDELSAIIEHQIIAPRQRAPKANIPAELEAVVLRAMARRRRDRFASVKDLQAEIERFWDGKLLESAKYSVFQRVAKWVRRHPTLAMSGTVSVVFVAVLGVVMTSWMAQIERASAAELVRDAETARRAEAEQVAQERQRLVEAMNAGNFSHVLQLLTGQVKTGRDAAATDFVARFQAAEATGKSHTRFVRELGAETIREYLAAFNRLIEAHEKWQVPIEASDYNYRGIILSMGFEDYYGSIVDFNRAIALDPKLVDAYTNRGFSKYSLGDFKGAARDFTLAIEIDPTSVTAHNNRAIANGEMGDLIGAIRDFDRAIELDPQHATAFLSRAIAYTKIGNHAAALRDCDRAIEITPENAGAFYNRNGIKTALGDPIGAMRDLDRALQIDPDFVAALAARGTAKFRQGNYAEAIRDYDRVIELDPGFHTGFTNRGAIKRKLNDERGAIDDFTRALALDPQNWQALLMRGEIRVGSNIDRAEGIRDFQQAYRLCSDPATRQQVARWLRQLGETVPE